MSITLPGENFSRDSVIFAVTYTYREALPRPTDLAGEADVRQPVQYESGITERTAHIFAPNHELALAAAKSHLSHHKDLTIHLVEFARTQLDLIVTMRSGPRA